MASSLVMHRAFLVSHLQDVALRGRLSSCCTPGPFIMVLNDQVIDIPLEPPSTEASERFRLFVARSQLRWAQRKAARTRALPRRRISNSWTSRRTVSSETPILVNN